MTTHISKGHYGWTARTQVPLDEEHALDISTMKRSNGAIVTIATRVKLADGGFSFVMFQDFNMRVLSESGRATEKFVTDQHQRALALLEEIKSACERHYPEAYL